jgi:NAD(P)-dependent dehydrogenase (short-subunit alcohol dehydrogenase family)
MNASWVFSSDTSMGEVSMVATSSDMVGKTVLVTGATAGIGKHTARALAMRGASVIITGRDVVRGQACVAELSAACGHDRVHLCCADMSQLAGVRDLAAQVRSRCSSLDVLINNAGVAASERRETPDGLELNVAVNVVAPHLLTSLLEPLLTAAPAGRVIAVTGGEHPRHLDLEDLQSLRTFEGLATYSRTKLLMMALMLERAQRALAAGVTCNVCYPGQASTTMTRSVTPGMLPRSMRWAFRLFTLLVREDGGASAARAARSSEFLAASPDVAGVTGAYFDRHCRRVSWPKPILDPVLRAQLWDAVTNIVGPC